MARSKWDELVSNAPSGSRSEVVGQLVRAVSAGSGDSGSESALGVFSSVTQGAGEFGGQISSLTTQMSSLTAIQQTLTGATQDNTQALTQNTSSKSGSGSSVGGAVGSIASNVLGGSILSPILGGLMDLFGVGDSNPPAMTATPFMLPAPVQYQGGIAGDSPGQVTPVSYGATGEPRSQTASPTTHVSIQVSAMDSQSFLDHSDEIATAVRSALLNSHPLADVISEL